MPTVFVIRPRTGNIGNDIIALGMEGLMRRAFGGDVNIVTLPSSADGGGGLSSRSIYEMNRVADGVIVGPGNLFENGSLFCDVDALAALAPPAMLFSVSMARVHDRSGAFAPRTDSLPASKIQALCRAVSTVLVRDHATRSHLEGLGVNGARVVGCPTILLTPDAVPLPEPDPSAVGAVLISVRSPALMSVPHSLQARVRADIRRLVDLAKERGHGRVKLLCHERRDLAFAAEFPDLPMLYTEDTTRFLGWLRDCSMSLTFRLHAFVSSMALGVASIHLSYDERASNLIGTLGLDGWNVDFVDTPDIIPAVRERWESIDGSLGAGAPFQPLWTECREIMSGEMAGFASRVTGHALTHRF